MREWVPSESAEQQYLMQWARLQAGRWPELELLYHLASHPNIVFNRDQLLDEVWGFEYYGGSRTIDVHIKRLREKLNGVSPQWALRTVWSVGYKFEVTDAVKDAGAQERTVK